MWRYSERAGRVRPPGPPIERVSLTHRTRNSKSLLSTAFAGSLLAIPAIFDDISMVSPGFSGCETRNSKRTRISQLAESVEKMGHALQ